MARNVSPTELSNSSPPHSKGSNNDDWTCDECGNVNFARRNNCNRCDKARTTLAKKRKLGTEIGKAAAEKSGGLFNAEDWQCYKCANVNWARRQQCNVCNTPKFAVMEERTGFGGGYNDREVVEYKERQESDDEYDEFGRRKKRRKYSDRSSYKDSSDEDVKKIDDSLDKKTLNKEEIEEEDEDEEEDDDGDLSKYDLSDFGDATNSNDSKKK
ncbi:zinc finger Ran-binding domain-containing protein 2 [Coccinella septempunctata]|uniref:zinc finger Ran-binding domain-containing protein 2 n=1 Tax=Coccinella septempunctata TaxID=41139 RepID=UPI001D09499C|nr:zinc finger Ran-binding domain-containing protein 2 [Coccinella septempunctata]XP_044754287.1 zinc finger Ran-binding domain-containing protein 2 [Coccinella septempunctata]XP_044754288.1 zinc finger Ran-binding domain-containing protein 2 [Coccinella septempunctata]